MKLPCVIWFALLTGHFFAGHLPAEERFLLAADNQVIEVNRAGQVTDLLKVPDQDGVYDAWRLPDGGIAFVHRGGLMVFDAAKKLILRHDARTTAKGAEANSCAVLDGGKQFAMVDSGACEIRVVDLQGKVVSTTPLPDLSNDQIHFRFRAIREVPGEKAFWVAQNLRKILLKVEIGTGTILASLPLTPLLKPSTAPHKAYSVIQAADGTLFTTTSTGNQILHLSQTGKAITCWTAAELGLTCRYLNGQQLLTNGNLLVACSDFHLKKAAESPDLLAEVTPQGHVVWRLTRNQLIDHVEGHVEGTAGIEELRIANVHAYESDHLAECLNVRR